jgi:hypothetical protein
MQIGGLMQHIRGISLKNEMLIGHNSKNHLLLLYSANFPANSKNPGDGFVDVGFGGSCT